MNSGTLTPAKPGASERANPNARHLLIARGRSIALEALTPVLLALVLALASGCSDRSPVTPDSDLGAFESVITSGGDFEAPDESETITPGSTRETVMDDGTRWICTTKTVQRTSAPDEYKTLDPNSEIVFPGALIQGSTVADATPEPIAVRRAAGSFSIDLVNGSQGVRATVDEVTQSRVAEALNDILADNNGVGAANFSYSSKYVQSREHLAAELGINVSTISTEFDANIEFQQDSSFNYWLVKLDQVYYTMRFDWPTSIDEVFAPQVTPDQLGRFIGPGNPAAYISSVTYGRIYYLLIQSKASREQLRASVEASYQAAVVGGEIDAGVEYVKDLEETTVQVFAVGGDQNRALATFNGDFEAVREFLTEGGDIDTGRPLSYTLRSVKDNRTVYVKVNNEFDIEECEPVVVQGSNPIVWYSGSRGIASQNYYGLPAILSWEDSFGNESATGIPVYGRHFGFLYDDVARGKPAVYFQSWQSDGGSSGTMEFPALSMRNTDYTVFVLAQKMTSPGDNYQTQWIWGTSQELGKSVTMGWDSDTSVFISHGGGNRLVAQLDAWAQTDFKLYTFRFSQNEGMSIYVNGSLAASDPSMTQPLTGFTGAQLGAADENGFPDANHRLYLAEFKAFGAALTEEQREREEDQILREYGFIGGL